MPFVLLYAKDCNVNETHIVFLGVIYIVCNSDFSKDVW